MTVKEAVHKAYKEMSGELYTNHLINRVRKLMPTRRPTDRNILRRLRDLRNEEMLNYVSVNNMKSIYQKLKVGDIRGYKSNPRLLYKYSNSKQSKQKPKEIKEPKVILNQNQYAMDFGECAGNRW